MKKIILSNVFAVALLATAGWGVIKSKSNDAGLNNLALSNVEALAQNEGPGRVDCIPAPDVCPQLVIYPGGDWGMEFLFKYEKREGWL